MDISGALLSTTALLLLPLILLCLRWLNDWWYLFRAGSTSDGCTIPPGSMGWPVIGELLDFLWCFKFAKRPDDFIAKRKARYGDTGVYRTHLFGYPTIVTCTPQLNKQVLGTMTENGSVSTGWPSTQLLGSSSVAVVDGPAHRTMRRQLAEAFSSPNAQKALLTATQPLFISVFQEWASRGRILAYEDTKVVLFSSICDMLVSFKSKALLQTMESLYRRVMAGVRSMTINIPGTAFHRALESRKKLTNILLEEVRLRTEKGVRKQDFMQSLIDSRGENGEKMSEKEVVENVVSLILGGYESTSNVLTWALYYLAKYPESLEKLKQETRSIAARKSGGDGLLTIEDIRAMEYTPKVADELIRLSNVSPFIFRRVAEEDVVVNGYKFPKNWRVIVWIRSIHVDSAYYSDPLEFNPDRWSESKPKLGTYTVFGLGPRYCPGSSFARLQVMMFLYHVCINYRWELLNPEAGFTYQPNPKPRDGAEIYFTRAA